MTDLDVLIERIADLVVEKLAAKNGGGHTPADPDRLLDARAAAQVLGVKVRWLYSRPLPFRVTLPGSRSVRFSEQGIRRYIERRLKSGPVNTQRD